MEDALRAQRDEATGHQLYAKLARSTKNKNNREILEKISNEELSHYNTLKGHTGRDVGPARLKVFLFTLISKLFGLTFCVKWMENGEKGAQAGYAELGKHIAGMDKINKEEEAHEKALIAMISEERLSYVGSMVLGLNDALVELTGSLAGLSFAFQNTSLIALSGLIMGIAASFSMAASEYLSKRADGEKNAGRSSLYTGVAYIMTVGLLVLPFLVLADYRISIVVTLISAVLVIMVFTFYMSVVKEYNFKRRFAEMAGISLGVAGLSFIVGVVVKSALGVEV